MNQAEIPQGQGSGFIWDTKVHLDLSELRLAMLKTHGHIAVM